MGKPDECCEVRNCEAVSSLVYSASKSRRQRGVCALHWRLHCDGVINLKNKKTYKNRR